MTTLLVALLIRLGASENHELELEKKLIERTVTSCGEWDVVFISDEHRNLDLADTKRTWNGLTHYTTEAIATRNMKTQRIQAYFLDVSANMTIEAITNLMSAVRAANPWSFLIVFVKTKSQETDLRRKVLSKPVFDVYIIAKQGKDFGVYELCAYCNYGQHTINQINTWTEEKGFKSFTLESSSKGSFFGYVLNVGCVPVGVGFNAHPQPDGTTTYSGREWDMLQFAGEKLNFTVEIVIPLDEAFGAKVIENGKERFTGVVGDIVSGRSDIGAGLITPTPLRREAIDNINIFYIDAARILSIKPGISPSWQSFIRCFSQDLWIAFFSSLAAVTIGGWLIMRRESEESLFDTFLNMVSIFCWEDTPLIYKKHKNIRVLLAGWMVGCTVLGAAYSGALLSKILTPSYDRLPIEDLDETIAVWMTFKGTYMAHLFDHRPEVAARLKPMSSLADMMEITFNNPRDHAILSINSLSRSTANRLFQDPYRQHPFYQSKRSMIPDIHSWLVPKGAPYKNALDIVVLDMIAGGFLQAFDEVIAEQDKRIGRQKYLGKDIPPKALVTKLSYGHVQGSFNILFGGYVVGAIFFIIEHIRKKWFSKRKKAILEQ